MNYQSTKVYFDSEDFARQYHTDAPLGSFCYADHCDFALWAPTAETVTLNLYTAGDGGEAPRQLSMEAGEKGLWQLSIPENLEGFYYTYSVTVDGVCRTTADPYARSCGLNGQRSMVIDLDKTDPEGWAQDKAPARQPEDIVYEIHIKDFSWDPASGISPEYRGKFLGLCQPGTTLNHDGIHPTGMDYLKRLGVTHLELLPFYDYGSVDEAGHPEQFNWGYDPVNYNCPEGSYATDPRHGEVRVRELKETVAALHKNGFRVIMDVVYNHTYNLDSCLFKTVPWYFHRQKPNGSTSNGSGCGNDVAAERSMCARYILDSVLYWAEEYHIDGFRFDLMGLLPVELMNEIRTALDTRFGKGEKLVFGEPWRAGESFAAPGTRFADKPNLTLLDNGIGAFCDATRDAIKGNLMQEDAKGFVNGGDFRPEELANCIVGWANIPGEFTARTANQTIGYLSSHDDWTLWDRLVRTMDPQQNYARSTQKLLQANRLAAALMYCCQGHLFLLSGEEFARTKYGVKNSFCSPMHINQLDWCRAWENESLVNYYRGLMALRKQLPGLCDKSEAAPHRVDLLPQPGAGCAAVMIDNGGEHWKKLLLLVNTGKEYQGVSLPSGVWQMLVNHQSSFCWQEQLFVRDLTEIPPMSVLLLGC